jgi:bifunctional non-homologous end joining protein LigD
MSNVMKDAQLFFKEGSSDKVYNAEIVSQLSGYMVNFAYGRRGSSLTTGSKTASPVNYDQALKIFDKLVNEKKSKGYKEVQNGIKPPSSIGSLVGPPSRDTGLRPQLLNEIEEKELEKYITDPLWCAQEKYDGVRRMILKTRDAVIGTNRKGLSIPMSAEINSQLIQLDPDKKFVLDGEAIGDSVYIFDLVNELPFKARYKMLAEWYPLDGNFLKLAPVAWTTKEKRDLLARLKKDNAEGIVFKKIDSLYNPGRPNSGGDQLKFKFVATATCVVTGGNLGKSSVSLAVYDKSGNQVPVGNATVYANQKLPAPGALVEVRYLYYFPGGSLFQPVLLGERDDLSKEDCTIEQLKLKREEEIIL